MTIQCFGFNISVLNFWVKILLFFKTMHFNNNNNIFYLVYKIINESVYCLFIHKFKHLYKYTFLYSIKED